MNCPRIQHNCILHTGRGHKQRRKRATSIIHPLFGLCTRNTIEFFLRYMIRQRVLRLSVQLSGLYCSRSIPFLFPFLSGGSFDETPRFCCAFSFFGNRPFSTNETRPGVQPVSFGNRQFSTTKRGSGTQSSTSGLARRAYANQLNDAF